MNWIGLVKLDVGLDVGLDWMNWIGLDWLNWICLVYRLDWIGIWMLELLD